MTPTDTEVVVFYALFAIVLTLAVLFCGDKPERESVDRRVARVLAALPDPAPAPAPSPPVTLPCFPYAQGRASERLVCVICLELLRHGELCSKVPACRHMFHKECIDVWARSSGSCPLCRVKIVPGIRESKEVSAADDMV